MAEFQQTLKGREVNEPDFSLMDLSTAELGDLKEKEGLHYLPKFDLDFRENFIIGFSIEKFEIEIEIKNFAKEVSGIPKNFDIC